MLKSSTKVDDKISLLNNTHILVMLFVQSDVYEIIIQVPFILLIYVFRINVYLLKSWIFNVFHPRDTSIYLIER
jgi:hypothetical protein